MSTTATTLSSASRFLFVWTERSPVVPFLQAQKRHLRVFLASEVGRHLSLCPPSSRPPETGLVPIAGVIL